MASRNSGSRAAAAATLLLVASQRGRVQRRAVDSAAAVKEALAQKEAEYRSRQAAQQSSGGGEIPALASLPRTSFVDSEGLLQVPQAGTEVRASVYAIFDPDGVLQYVGVSRNAQVSLRAHFVRRPHLCGSFATFHLLKPDRSMLEAVRQAWQREGGVPPGNSGAQQVLWENPVDALQRMSLEDREAMKKLSAAAAEAALREAVLQAEIAQVEAMAACGCQELILFDTKLKAKGQLDLDTAAPIGLRRPEGGVAASFSVKLKLPDGSEATLDCPPDLTILEVAEKAGLELPSSCKSGACSACAGKLLEGRVDQSDQSFLDEKQQAEGYVMTCVCYPRSNLVLETGRQADVV